MVGFEAFGLPKGVINCKGCWRIMHCNAGVAGMYLSKELQKAALKHNLMLLTCGNDTIRSASRDFAVTAKTKTKTLYSSHHDRFHLHTSRPRFIPPLTVSAAEMDEGLQKVSVLRFGVVFVPFALSHSFRVRSPQCARLIACFAGRCRHARCGEEDVTRALNKVLCKSKTLAVECPTSARAFMGGRGGDYPHYRR